MIYDLTNYKDIEKCRTCLSKNLETVLDLGEQPLANSLRDVEIGESIYPLVLMGCLDCSLLQLSINVNPKVMFSEYFWVTGTSKVAQMYCRDLASKLVRIIPDEAKSILEIGSNDGTLLREIDNLNVFNTLIGVDPANNINMINAKKNDEISYYSDFFDTSFTKKFLESNPKVDVVVARNVLSHVPDLHEVFVGISNITTEKAELVIEFHESSIILREVHYDSIYHEHTYYHNIKSMTDLLTTHGFFPYHLEESPISGGSFVLFASKLKKEKSKNLTTKEDREKQELINDPATWHKFANKVRQNIKENRIILEKYSNTTSCAYGASARSSTLLNALNVDKNNLKAIADKNPLKWGKLSPGLGLRIENPQILINKDIKNIFISAFNFESEIVSELRNVHKWSGNVHVPLPIKPRVYSV